jgi:formylglycine-generating enzyme required for sulfatase activity
VPRAAIPSRERPEGAREGRLPGYYTSARQSTPYRTGDLDLLNDWVRWDADGYRLPTEAEWEKAARGGGRGHRLPWITAETIQHSLANYYAGQAGVTYDASYPAGYDPAFATGGYPYTSPVGSFPPNGYGLYDMAGNVQEWCWDWFEVYDGATQADPRGPVEGWDRVARGGSWYHSPVNGRAAHRLMIQPASGSTAIGFRCVRPAGPEANP